MLLHFTSDEVAAMWPSFMKAPCALSKRLTLHEDCDVELTPGEAHEALKALRSVGARPTAMPRPNYYDKLREAYEEIYKLRPTHEFRRRIEALCFEERRKATGTPDFILAAYLEKCLERFPQEGVSGQQVLENWTRIFGEAPS